MDKPVLVQPEGLAAALNRIRKEAGLSGKELAAQLGEGWGPSKVSRIQTGKRPPYAEDIEAWCTACGVPDEAEALIAILEDSGVRHKPWRQRHARGYGDIQDAMTSLHRSAVKIVTTELYVIPGVIQTPAYTRATLTTFSNLWPNHFRDVEAGVTKRGKRASLLDEQDPDRSYQFVICEAALRFGPCSAADMIGTLLRLRRVADYPTVELFIIPDVADSVAMPITGFDMFDLPGEILILLETCTGVIEFSSPDHVETYQQYLAWLQDSSVTGDEAKALIDAAIEQHRS